MQAHSNWIHLYVTSYYDKVKANIEQDATLCNLLKPEGYEVQLLPIVLGTQGSIFTRADAALQPYALLAVKEYGVPKKVRVQAVQCLFTFSVREDTLNITDSLKVHKASAESTTPVRRVPETPKSHLSPQSFQAVSITAHYLARMRAVGAGWLTNLPHYLRLTAFIYLFVLLQHGCS